jgi:hypothetical protein
MSTILAKMAVQIGANTAEFTKALKSVSGDMSKFKSDVNSIGTALITAFSVKEIANFVLEANRLVGTFDGVKRAFDRLPNSTLLMDKLKDSTHGTVDELQLMQQALRAKNFGISVKDLGTYLEFAAIRAQQTGESIDYMVNSIILGLGRGSIKILDNLQVNIAKIKETVKETGVSLQEAFRQQVIEQMQVIGGYAETSATSVDRLTTAFKAFKLEASKKFESSDFINNFTEGIKGITLFLKANGDLLKVKQLQTLEIIEKQATDRAKKFTDSLKGSLDEQKEAVQQQMNTLVELINKRNSELSKVNDELLKTGKGHATLDKQTDLISQQQSMKANIKTMERTNELLKEYFLTMSSGGKDTAKELGIIEQLRADIDNQEFFLEKATTKKDIADAVAKLKSLNAELDALLGKSKKADTKFRGLTMEIIPSGHERDTVPDVENLAAINAAKEFSKELTAIGTSAEFAGGALITLTDGMGPFKEAAREAIDISGLVAGGITNIADAFGAAAGGAGKFGQNIVRALADFAGQFGALLIATGIGKIAFDKFKSGPAMIAAGAALVALSGAVRASISNRPNLGGSGGGGSFPSRGVTTNSNFQNLSLSTSVSGTEFNVLLGNTAISDSYVKPKWRR